MRVLRVLTRANLGGPARQCALLHRPLRECGVQELVVHGRVDGDESEHRLQPRLTREEFHDLGETASGFLRVEHLTRRVDPASDIESLSELLAIARRFRPQVVHTHTSKAGWIGALLAMRLRVPLVHTFHGHVLSDYFGKLSSKALVQIERLAARRRALAICVSTSCGRELEDFGVLERDAWTRVPPAVVGAPPLAPARRTLLREQLGLRSDAFAIAWAGRFVPIKNPELALRTVSGRRGPLAKRDVQLLFFGDGPLRAGLEAQCVEGALAPFAATTRAESLASNAAGFESHDGSWSRERRVAVAFQGADPAFPVLLPAFDVALSTSRREGLPLSAVEALIAGVPLAGTRAPGLIDLQGDGVTLVEEDPRMLAGACIAASQSPPSASRRRQLIEEHDPERIAGLLAAAYESLL